MRVGVIMYETSLTKGQELVAQRMVRELRREGTEAYLITSVYHDYEEVVPAAEVSDRGGYLHSFDEALDIPVVRVASQQGNWPPRRIMFTDFVPVLDKIVDDLRLDVLVTHSTLWNGPEEVAKFVEWRRNQARGGAPVRPLVFCHMSHFQEPSDERYDLGERTFRQAWNQVSLPAILKVADFILVTTPYEKDSMKKVASLPEDKFIMFPGGIDSALLEFGQPAEFRHRFGIPPDVKLVSYVGSVEERKNPKSLLALSELLRGREDIRFVIAGRLEGSYGEEVKAASERSPLVTVTGPLSESEYLGLLSESYLNINMSRSEALGLAQIEFMYKGVPVITSGAGGQSWIVKDGSTGFVVQGPDDLKGAARAIATLVDDQWKRDKLGRKAREAARGFTMPVLIRQFTKKVSARLMLGRSSSDKDLEPDEKLIEAWVKKGYKVAVTTKKLLVDSAKGGAQEVIPLAEITRFRRHRKISWRPLLIGGIASIVLFAAAYFDQSARASLREGLISLSSYITPDFARGIVWIFSSIPVSISLAFLALTATEGYQILYGVRKVFLPLDFVKALRIADELTPRSLFQPEQIP